MDINKIAAIATIVGAIATIISTVIAVRAKEEAKSILKQIKEGNIKNSGKIEVKNNGQNTGIINGINSGDIHRWKTRMYKYKMMDKILV